MFYFVLFISLFFYRKKTKPLGESFIGYHADVCPAVIQKIYKSKSKDYKDDEKQVRTLFSFKFLTKLHEYFMWVMALERVSLITNGCCSCKEFFSDIQLRYQRSNSLIHFRVQKMPLCLFWYFWETCFIALCMFVARIAGTLQKKDTTFFVKQ